MTLDGFLSATSSFFDGAISCLIIALEDRRGIPEGDRIRAWKRNWKAAKRVADKPPVIALTCRTAVDVALTGDDDDLPSGWLAQLRHLRNRSTHEETLSRGLHRGEGNDQTRLRVPGLGEVEPISYLGASLVHSRDLIQQLLSDVDAINL